MPNRAADTSDPGRLLLLDLDGTIVDSAEGLRASVNRLLVSRDLAPITPADIKSMIGDGVAMLVRRALDYRGAAFDEAALAQFNADYGRNAAESSALFPGVRAMLGRALQDGWSLAVCTNKPTDPARTLLSSLGIAHLFITIGGGDSFPVRKPNPDHLRLTVKQAGCVPERTIMVGDHRNDVQAALGAGIRSIFAAWGYGTTAMAAGASVVAATPDKVTGLAATLLSQGAFKGRAG